MYQRMVICLSLFTTRTSVGDQGLPKQVKTSNSFKTIVPMLVQFTTILKKLLITKGFGFYVLTS